MKNSKRSLSLFLAIIMCFSLCIPTFAATHETKNIPPWVEDGETWYPANGVMPLEDFGNCPKGHTGPSGYTYQGYTTGKSSGHYDGIAAILQITSYISGNKLTVGITGISSTFLGWLQNHENPNIDYFKYVYTKGSSTFFHIIYAEKITNTGYYTYITCETFYK